MKRLFLFISLVFAFSAFAESPCGSPIPNVIGKIIRVDFYEYGPNMCLIKDTLNEYYFLDDCKFDEGDIVKGEVRIHWTHKDSNGKPVCDFKSFTPYI